MSEQDYIELQPGDIIQEGDEWQNEFGRWRPFLVLDGSRVQVRQSQLVRRPIGTAQQAVDQPQRERIAYEELRPGTEVQPGDQYRNTQGRWVEYTMDTSGVPIVGPTAMARRPYKISAILEIGDALANAQKAATQLQDERDELKTALRESHAAHEFTMKQRLTAIAERNQAERLLAKAQMERDKAWSDQKVIQAYRDAALQELTQAREASQQLLQTITDNAAHFADHTKVLEQERDDLQIALIESRLEQQRKAAEVMEVCKERDEVEAELKRVQEVVGNLYNEPTARQVQDMLRTWATELDWSAGCFDSVGRDEIDTIQRTLIAVMERIETILNPEGGSDDN